MREAKRRIRIHEFQAELVVEHSYRLHGSRGIRDRWIPPGFGQAAASSVEGRGTEVRGGPILTTHPERVDVGPGVQRGERCRWQHLDLASPANGQAWCENGTTGDGVRSDGQLHP